jgi:threonine dehydrogenase-like Zn-dependent dehydrogenase
MKAIQIQAPGNATIVDVPVPEIAANEVLVQVVCCVTCPQWDLTLDSGVDIFSRPGYPHYPIPWGYPGHEMSGAVVAVGAEVTGYAVGDRVCTLCGAGETVPGFYCEYINRPTHELAHVPEGLSWEAAANMEMCRFLSPFVRKLGSVAGKRTGVTGVGPAGLIAVQMLRALGASEVIAIDLLPDRLALAARLGATGTVNSTTDEVQQLEAAPLEASVDCSGVAAALQFALDHTAGPIAVFGVPHGEVRLDIRHWGHDILSHGPQTDEDTKFVLDLWRRGLLNTEALVTTKLPFERYAEALELLRTRKAIKVGLYPG